MNLQLVGGHIRQTASKGNIELSFASRYEQDGLTRTFREASRNLANRILSQWTDEVAHQNMVAMFHYLMWSEGFPEEVHRMGLDDLGGDPEAMEVVHPILKTVNRYRQDLWNPDKLFKVYTRLMKGTAADFDDWYAEGGTLPDNCVVILHDTDQRGELMAIALAIIGSEVVYPSNKVRRRAESGTTYIKGAFL